MFPCQPLNLECCCSKRIQKMFPAISQNKNRKFSSCHHFVKLQKVCNFDGCQFPHSTTFNHKYTSLRALKVNKFLLNQVGNGWNVTLYFHWTHLTEVHHRAVDIDPPVLFVPLDAVEVAAPRLVHRTPQRYPGARTCLDLIPQAGTCTGHVTRGQKEHV